MNRLQSSSSLYLKQHADNPVDWWSWGPEALAEARKQDKPILLSIGYAACHWCHVMAHESFEDEHIAEVMNRLFINIKVDREQRPDLDRIYQTAHQLMTQRPGGWPLTMFLTPDGELPFFGGTYFPPQARHGLPGFVEVLERVAEFYNADPAEAKRQGGAVQEVFAKLEPASTEAISVDASPIAALRDSLAQSFDDQHGGFGRAPKFPQTPSLLRLLNHWRASANDSEPDLQALYMAAHSQTTMANGGLVDQVGGGFFRYCTDQQWQIPHFEKMLYDNAQLLSLYSASAQATGDELFAATARGTADWLLRDMQLADGGFASTLDADTEQGEGAFYTWTPDEIGAVIADADFAFASAAFGLDQPANFEGRWHLTLSMTTAELAEQFSLSDSQAQTRLDGIRAQLRVVRDQRQAPSRDDKVLTSWNGLTIKALAQAARVFEEPRYARAASQAAQFAASRLLVNGELKTAWQDGHEPLPAYLDDYAMLVDGLLELLQIDWQDDWLSLAMALADDMLARFLDTDNGGFFFTARNHETLMYRPKPISDDATPAGNAVAVRALLRLGHLIGDARYLDAAEATLQFARAALVEYPQAHVTLIESLSEFLAPIETIVLRGDPATIRQWQQSAQSLYAPNRMIVAPHNGASLPEGLAVRVAPETGALAYVCQGTQCLAAIDSWKTLAAAIRNR
ncbi:MAG: thioredoxin domain-containing protein [Pseudomonadota bacterium]